MAFRLFLFLIGFGTAVAGGVSTIAYLNLLTTGHGFVEYLMFITGRVECYLFPIGVSIIGLSIFIPSPRN
jgi:hypothetical protein